MNAVPSRALVVARLVRLPNVFTALADIALGAIAGGLQNLSWGNLSLAGASACLYSAGMVWNDLFDLDQDRRERPHRPLPSGQVSLRSAIVLAVSLTVAGCGFALVAGGASFLLASALVGAILLYDGWLKRTPFGPVGMALCRILNVMLGLTLVDFTTLGWPLRIHLASVVAVYVAGVTWFARREAATSQARILRAAAVVIGASLAAALAVPLHVPAGTSSPAFPYLLVVFGITIGLPIRRAIRKSAPETVQKAVKTAILGIIALDAVLATAISGWYGLLILLLLPPALLLGRRVYST